MRILLSAGIDDFAMGKSRDEVVEGFIHSKNIIDKDKQNDFYPNINNELVIATKFNPPNICCFADNGQPPQNHISYCK